MYNHSAGQLLLGSLGIQCLHSGVLLTLFVSSLSWSSFLFASFCSSAAAPACFACLPPLFLLALVFPWLFFFSCGSSRSGHSGQSLGLDWGDDRCNINSNNIRQQPSAGHDTQHQQQQHTAATISRTRHQQQRQHQQRDPTVAFSPP